MSGGSDTERKFLPPSPHKLRRARDRGQVMGSEQFVNAATFLAGILAIILTWKTIAREFASLLEAGAQPVLKSNSTALMLAMYQTFYYVIVNAAIIFGTVGVAAIIANIVQKGGVFSADPVSPKFERVSLAQGLKRLFALKNWAELGAGLLRISIWMGLCALVIYWVYPMAIRSSYCGLTCQFNLSVQSVLLLAGIAALMLIAVGVSDLPLQHFLFLHEMRMGKSEAKRDHKESNGDPIMRNARKDIGRSMIDTASAASGGIKSAAVLLRGEGVAVALRYDPQKYPVPVVIAKGIGSQSLQLVQSAHFVKVPVVVDSQLASTLYKEVQMGSIIAKKHFDKVAMALVKAKM